MNIVTRILKDHADFQVGISSIIGTRQYQQDYVYYYSDPYSVLAVICDGMGGLNGGERASREAARVLGEAFEARDKNESIPEFFLAQAKRMDECVAGLRGDGGAPLRAGTTAAAVAAEKGRLYWMSIGDSKIYIIRNEEMSQVTREHNYRLTLKESLKSGIISQEQYNMEEKKNQAEALISYIGIGNLAIMDINKIPFEMMAGDIILLCSDGLYKSLSDSQILALIGDNDVDMTIAADRLSSMALHLGRGGQDNTSVLALRYLPDTK